MGVVLGSVCVEETGRGVAGLSVSVIDVDDNLAASKNALTAKTITDDRLGSVVTDEQGRFQLTFDGEGMRMPNLAVMVGAPEVTALQASHRPSVAHQGTTWQFQG